MSENEIRTVTDEEVAHFRDYGWVKLKQLVAPELVARMLERAKAHMGPGGDASVPRPDIDTPSVSREDRHFVAAEEDCFAKVAYSAKMGENARRLFRREVGVLLSTDMLAVKIGTRQGSSSTCVEWTPWHQDAPDQPLDRNGYINFWLALDGTGPQNGGIRFLDHSHRLGLLGCTYSDLHALYPELAEMHVSEPELEPGDATAHAMYTVHGAPTNETAAPRWGYITTYIPEDALFTGGMPWSLATVAKLARAKLKPGDDFSGILRKVY